MLRGRADPGNLPGLLPHWEPYPREPLVGGGRGRPSSAPHSGNQRLERAFSGEKHTDRTYRRLGGEESALHFGLRSWPLPGTFHGLCLPRPLGSLRPERRLPAQGQPSGLATQEAGMASAGEEGAAGLT